MKRAFSILAIGSVVGIGAVAQAANTYSTDFENFTLGADVNTNNPMFSDPAQGSTNNWRGNGYSGLAANGVAGSQYDGEIVDTDDALYGQAYRLSNAKVSGNYDKTHAATPTVGPVGESSTLAPYSIFKFSFHFKAATNSVQDGLSIDVTPFKALSDRQGILRITDDSTDGFAVRWASFDSTGTYNVQSVETGLARNQWHSIDVTMNFVDGPGNDVVDINLNGTKTSGLDTWEDAFFYSSAVDIDSLVFRAVNPNDFPNDNNTGGVSALDGGGVYFDNVSVSAIPEPTAAALVVLGVAGFGLRRRHRA